MIDGNKYLGTRSSVFPTISIRLMKRVKLCNNTVVLTFKNDLLRLHMSVFWSGTF